MAYTESSLSRLNKDDLIRIALDRHNSTLYTKAILTDIKNEFSKLRKSYNPTGTPRRIHVDSTRILRRYVEDQISTNFHVISTYFFDVILLVEKSTWFPCIFFDVISLVEKSTLFPRIFFDVISMVEKPTLFPRTFIGVVLLVEVSTLFLLTSFDVILMGKDLTTFLVSCKLMKTLEKIFPVFVTLSS